MVTKTMKTNSREFNEIVDPVLRLSLKCESKISIGFRKNRKIINFHLKLIGWMMLGGCKHDFHRTIT